MEEIKKKNKKLNKIAIILFIMIILLSCLDIYLYIENKPILDIQLDMQNVQYGGRHHIIYNAPLEEFLGKQKGSSIKALLNTVISNNAQFKYDDEYITCITMKDKKDACNGKDIADLMLKDINIKEYYEVTMYQNDQGFINKIFIRREGESKTEEELNLEKNQIEYSKHLEQEQKELEERNKKEEKNKKIAIIVISILAIIGLILIIKGLIILKKDDDNKKRKVLIAFIITESIITGGLLLVLLGIITGEIYYII